MVGLREKVTEVVPPFSDRLAQVAQAVGEIRFGVIQLTIHDGKLVQLDITEKRRFT